MRIENEMLKRFNRSTVTEGRSEISISGELDLPDAVICPPSGDILSFQIIYT